MDRPLLEYNPELHALEIGQAADEIEWSATATGVFSETEEMKLALALLEVTGERQLVSFLEGLISRAERIVGNFLTPPVRQALASVLKGVAQQVLPNVTRTGRHTGLSVERRAQASAKTVSVASRIFGFELEGLSPEDQELEIAKTFVRFAGAAVRNAINVPFAAPPKAVAQKAIRQTAKHYAPGLLHASSGAPSQAGVWQRRGPNIIVNL